MPDSSNQFPVAPRTNRSNAIRPPAPISVDSTCRARTWTGVDLSAARLHGANLARASLRGAKLAGADLRDTLLRNTDFTNADLRRASFAGAIMERTILVGANLKGAAIGRSAVVVETFLPPSFDATASSPWFADFPRGLAPDDEGRTR